MRVINTYEYFLVVFEYICDKKVVIIYCPWRRRKWSNLRGRNSQPIRDRSLIFSHNYWISCLLWLSCGTLFYKINGFKVIQCFLKGSTFPLWIEKIRGFKITIIRDLLKIKGSLIFLGFLRILYTFFFFLDILLLH